MPFFGIFGNNVEAEIEKDSENQQDNTNDESDDNGEGDFESNNVNDEDKSTTETKDEQADVPDCDNEDDTTDTESIVDNIEKSFFDTAKELHWFNDGNYGVYLGTMKEFYDDVKSKHWIYNRVIDDKHVKNIIKNKHSFREPFHIAYCNDRKQYYLIDGQHRISAYEELCGKINNEEILVYKHNVDKYNEVQTLFKELNNHKSLTYDDMPDEYLIKIIERLQKMYPTCITDKKTKLPYVNTVQLKTQMLVHKFSEKCKDKGKFVPIDMITNKIRMLNTNYRFKIKNKKETCKSCMIGSETYDKIIKNGFYLALDKKYEWIKTFGI